VTIDDAITRGRQALLVLLRDSCVITHTPLVSDGRGGEVPGTPTTLSVPCNVQRTLKVEEAQIADRLGVVSPAIIRLPVGVSIDSSDVIGVSGRTFQVVSPLDDTIQLTLKVLCKDLG
jgi:hypothetical protein